jgi:hypothetical protein
MVCKNYPHDVVRLRPFRAAISPAAFALPLVLAASVCWSSIPSRPSIFTGQRLDAEQRPVFHGERIPSVR